ncbi:hypothetical protein [Deferribacter autotrophicus]|nr:hypothetical protein [Deferribacter autotrophicus]
MVNVKRLLKKLKRLEQNPKDVDFETIKNILESLGYEMSSKSGGSHRTF